MKVLLYDSTNAFFTPGGKTTHALKLQKEISKLGVQIEFTRWWDQSQKDGDLIHFLQPDPVLARLARQRGMKTFCSLIFDYETNKSRQQQLFARGKIFLRELSSPKDSLYWTGLRYMDTVHFMHENDRKTALDYFPRYLNKERTVIIPHAYDPEDMNISSEKDAPQIELPNKFLISIANISPRKQPLLLAKYAKEAQVPIVFLGGHLDTDPYYIEFLKVVDNRYVFYPGYISKESKDYLLKKASGYVLLSLGESGCIAVYEAAAYNIPILLSNLPWAWGYEEPNNIFFCNYHNKNIAVDQLRSFYNNSGKLEMPPFVIHTWADVAQRYVEQYGKLIKNL